MLDALTLAKYIINKCTADHCPISNLQLQKILYYIQVEFLKNKGTPIFKDDIEAWMFGPVVRSVYNKYCGFGSMKIKANYDEYYDFGDNDKKIIDNIVEEKRVLKPWDLVDDTHADGKAWSRIYNDGRGNKEVIPKNVIQQYG